MTITLPHTTLFTSILGLWTIFLAIRVIQLRIGRNKYKKYEEETVERAVRGHGNLIENTPIFLILFFLSEYQQFNSVFLQTLGWLFVIGRLMHGICFGFMKQNMPLRVGGTLLSFLIISVLAINLLLNI